MYTIGFIDDDDKQFKRYKKKFNRLSTNLQTVIDLKFVEGCNTCEDVAEWIINNKAECLMVDYKLSNRYPFSGVELINCINKKVRELPCVILTSFPADAISEKLVVKPLIFDKEVMTEETDNPKVIDFAQMLIHSIEVFKNRMKINEKEYEILLEKYDNDSLDSNEYERFEELFKILKSYGVIEDVSIVSINKKVEDGIGTLICEIEKLLKK